MSDVVPGVWAGDTFASLVLAYTFPVSVAIYGYPAIPRSTIVYHKPTRAAAKLSVHLTHQNVRNHSTFLCYLCFSSKKRDFGDDEG